LDLVDAARLELATSALRMEKRNDAIGLRRFDLIPIPADSLEGINMQKSPAWCKVVHAV
jgi:hypothetical protein